MTDEMDVTNESAQARDVSESPPVATVPVPPTVMGGPPESSAPSGATARTHVSIPKRWLIVGGSALIAVLLLSAAFAGGVAVGSRAGHAVGRGERAIDRAFPNGDEGQGRLGDPNQSQPGPDGGRGFGGPQGQPTLPGQPDTQPDTQQEQDSSNQS